MTTIRVNKIINKIKPKINEIVKRNTYLRPSHSRKV